MLILMWYNIYIKKEDDIRFDGEQNENIKLNLRGCLGETEENKKNNKLFSYYRDYIYFLQLCPYHIYSAWPAAFVCLCRN